MSGAAQELVRLNVYTPEGGGAIGFYHTGVEVHGTEYVFAGGNSGGSGVGLQRPRVPPPGSGWTFYQTVEIAPLQKTRDEVQQIVAALRAEFSAGSYDLVERNCNHFSEAFCQRLCGQGIPSWVNALAGIGKSLGVGGMIRNAMGMGSGGGGKADVGAGGLASAGLLAGSAGADGDLSGEAPRSGKRTSPKRGGEDRVAEFSGGPPSVGPPTVLHSRGRLGPSRGPELPGR